MYPVKHPFVLRVAMVEGYALGQISVIVKMAG